MNNIFSTLLTKVVGKIFFLLKKNINTTTNNMTFFDHLEILRWHLIKIGIFIFISSLLVFYNSDTIFNNILLVFNDPNFWTYRQLNKLGLKTNFTPFKMINTQIFGQLMLHMTSSMIIGLFISIPYILWELWKFVKPGLYTQELKIIKTYILFIVILFIIGILFGYYVFIPISISFLNMYQISDKITNTYIVNDYIFTIIKMILINGIIFEIPIVLHCLCKLNIISLNSIKKKRKHVLIIVLIIAAIITPSPDILTQIIIAIPLYILYEISIFILYYTCK